MRWRRWAVAICVIGAALRFVLWSRGLPLQQDEAALALNLLDRSGLGLLEPLEHSQAAPWGFLFAVDALGGASGFDERALRAVPLLASVAALAVFARFLQERISRRWVALWALAFLAFSPTLVQHAANLKPYSSDVLVTAVLLLLYHRHGLRWPTVVAGTLAPWFSFPSVFVLGGIGLAGAGSVGKLVRVGGVWGASFGLYYVTTLGHVASEPFLSMVWVYAFAPEPAELFPWLAETTVDFFATTSWVLLPSVAAVAALWGWVRLARLDTDLAFIAVATALLTIGASALGHYPARDRVVLFFSPLAMVCLAAGFEAGLQSGKWAARSTCSYVSVCLIVGAAISGVESVTWRPAHDPEPMVAELDQRDTHEVVAHHQTELVLRFYTFREDARLKWIDATKDDVPDASGGWITWSPYWYMGSEAEGRAFLSAVEPSTICDRIETRGLVAWKVCGATTP